MWPKVIPKRRTGYNEFNETELSILSFSEESIVAN